MEGLVKDLFCYYKGKRVFVTGHTGFKGMWLCKILEMAGAEVIGYALPPETRDNQDVLYASKIENDMTSIYGDVRDFLNLKEALNKAEPEYVIHLAAQPLVTVSYDNPVETYATNVMGTVNILECVRQYGKVKSFLNVTTDKVYDNKEWQWGYRENEPLDGYDPYSNSKSCSELVTHSYKKSFFTNGTAISTARAGNVIGGGDFAFNRIIPDCVRAAYNREMIEVRNPFSTRPYQHVLEPLYVYLMILANSAENGQLAGWYNVGPNEKDCITTGELVDLFCAAWGEGISWKNKDNMEEMANKHEAGYLKLDCSKLKCTFSWEPRWGIQEAIEKTVEWSKAYQYKKDIIVVMERQINDFFRRIDNGQARVTR